MHAPPRTAAPRLQRFRDGIAAPAAFGGLIALGQAPLGWWWVSLAALAMLWHLAAEYPRPRDTAVLFWAAGTGYFLTALFWLVEPFLIAPEQHAWMAPFALILMAGGLALFWAVAGWLGAWLTPVPRGNALQRKGGGGDDPTADNGNGRNDAGRGLRFGLALALAFALAEGARGFLFTGFPWALLGHIWIDTPVAQLAALTGPLGLSLLTLVAVAVSVWALRPRTAAHRPAPAAARLLVAALVVGGLATTWLWGSKRLASPLPDAARPVAVRLVQPNAPQAEKWRYDLAEMFFYRHLHLSAAPPAPGTPPPDLVIWSETAVPFMLETLGIGLQMSAAAAAPASLALGVQRSDPDGRFFNSFALLDANGVASHVYDKHHLVPFGEYVPFAETLLGANYSGFAAQQLQGYSPGPGPVVLDFGALGLVLPLICYEAVFPRHLRTETRPDWVLQVTNDAWFGALTGPYQHLAQARLRAIEQGLPVVRVANTGVTAIIDARGQITASLPLNTMGALDGMVPGALPPTPYARFGDAPMGALLLGALALLVWRRRHGVLTH